MEKVKIGMKLEQLRTIIPILLFCIDNIILSIVHAERRIRRNGTQNSQNIQPNIELNNVQS